MPKNFLLKNEEIKNLTPQRDPILMVDVLYQATDAAAVTGLTILQDNLFCVNGFFTEPGIIEHVAQSLSIHAGYKALKCSNSINLGYIGEVKQFKIERLPKVGDQLVTKVKLISEVMDISLFDTEVSVNDTVIATGKLKIFMDKTNR